MASHASAATLGKQATRQTLRWFNWHVTLRAVFDTVCGGTTFLFVAFALSMGIAEASIARFTLAASVGCLFQVLVLPIAAQLSNRKRFIVMLGIAEALVLMACVVVSPWLPSGWQMAALTGAIFLAAAFLHMTRPVMDDWIASAIPGGLRGRYLGRRNQWLAGGSLLSMLVAGWLGDWVGPKNTTGLAVLLIIGAGFGVVSIAALARANMANTSVMRRFTWPELITVFAHPPFRKVILAFGLMLLPFLISVPFYQVFHLKVLKMNPSTIAAMMVGYQIVKIVSLRPAGRLVDRLGVRKTMLLCWPLYVIFFLVLGSSTEDRWWTACIAWTMVGLADGLWAVAYPTSLYGSVPADGPRPTYFAVSNIVVFMLLAIGALVAEPMLRLLKDVQWTWGTMTVTGFVIYFGLCGIVAMITGPAALLLSRHSPRTRIPG